MGVEKHHHLPLGSRCDVEGGWRVELADALDDWMGPGGVEFAHVGERRDWMLAHEETEEDREHAVLEQVLAQEDHRHAPEEQQVGGRQ